MQITKEKQPCLKLVFMINGTIRMMFGTQMAEVKKIKFPQKILLVAVDNKKKIEMMDLLTIPMMMLKEMDPQLFSGLFSFSCF